MPLSAHYGGSGASVMKSMMKTYKSKKTAKRVFYATEQKQKSLKERTTGMVRKGHLRMN